MSFKSEGDLQKVISLEKEASQPGSDDLKLCAAFFWPEPKQGGLQHVRRSEDELDSP